MATHAVPGTGLELILNAAEGVLQIVVTEDEAILCAQEWYRSERATEILAPALAELATSLGIRWSDLRRIACVRGPGSFTGIRIGLSTIKGMCLACGRPSLPVTSFGLVAYNVKCGGDFAVVIDAMHGMYYCQTFSCEGQPLAPPSYISGGGVAALGLPLFGFEELPLENYTRLNAGSCLPRAVERALGGGFASLGALYVRKSQAEEAASARP